MITLYDRMPHFIGSNASDDDLILEPSQQSRLMKSKVWVQEKLDGLAVAVQRVGRNKLSWELRPPWRGAANGAVKRAIGIYMMQRQSVFLSLLKPQMVLYGEWVWHTVSVVYDSLPDLFFCYAIRKPDGLFQPLEQTHQQCEERGLSCNEPIGSVTLDSIEHLRSFVGTSKFGPEQMEGLVVTRVKPGRWPNEAKWVEPDYKRVPTGQISGQRNILRTTSKLLLQPSDLA